MVATPSATSTRVTGSATAFPFRYLRSAAVCCGSGSLWTSTGVRLITTSPDAEVVQRYTEAGGTGPKYAQITVCWAESEEEAKQTAHRVWPNAALKGDLSQELALPLHFEQASQNVTPDDVAETVVCGPDPGRYREQIAQYTDAGLDHIYFHQVGPDQEGFFRFARDHIL